MRLPLMRLTVRWAMIAIIAIAALLGAFEAGRRWEHRNDPVDPRDLGIAPPDGPAGEHDLVLPPVLEEPK